MKAFVSLIVFLTVAVSCHGEDLVTVPWSEFKEIYRKNIEREIGDALPKPEKKAPDPVIVVVDRADFSLALGRERAVGRVRLSGKMVSGDPAKIPIFDENAALSEIGEITGGILLPAGDGQKGIAFLPDKNAGFTLDVSFLTQTGEDAASRFVSFQIPSCINNSLALTLPSGCRIIEATGVPDENGVRHFTARDKITVRFAEEKDLQEAMITEIDALSVISPHGKRIFGETHFIPVRPPSGPFTLKLPTGSQYVSSSLKGSRIKRLDETAYEISLPSKIQETFSVQFAFPESEEDALSFSLPEIVNNTGNVGNFIVREPEHMQMTITGTDLVSHIPVDKLTRQLSQAVTGEPYYMRVPPPGVLTISLRRFAEGSTPIEIDMFSLFEVRGKRIFGTTGFLPVRPVLTAFTLELPNGSQLVSSSLEKSWIKKVTDTSYEILLPPKTDKLFNVRFSVPESDKPGVYAFSLPSIRNNNGRQEIFAVREPDDMRVSVSGKGLVTRIPVAKLKDELKEAASGETYYMSLPSDETVGISATRLATVSTPRIVLDSAYFFTSFEENGGVLSVLMMDIPNGVGQRFNIEPVPNAEIWSLSVNGEKRKVYADESGGWIVPLDKDKTSCVELAFLRRTEKLGLHGTLETELPALGLPARNIHVGVALPERVQLLSLEGPVSPADGEKWPLPASFIGKRYFFSRSFYKGEEMKLSIYYKEPINQ